MFKLTLLGSSAVYSTKKLAEKNAANFVKKISNTKLLNEAFQKEDYQKCVLIWNDYVMLTMYGDSLHRIQIDEITLDEPFY